MSVMREANTQRGFCPIYTSTAQYQAGTPTSCGIFRCDTFVYHIYYAGMGVKLIKDDGIMLPNTIFKAFPFHSSEYSSNPTKIITSSTNRLSAITAQQISDMNPGNFLEIINAPIDRSTDDEINNTWKFAQDPSLSAEKRTLLMDKLGFIGRADMLPQLSEQYFKIDDKKVKSMLLRSTLTIYQKYFELKEYPKEKEILQNFYMQLLNTKLSDNDASIVIRGFTQLSTSDVVLTNVDKINNIFNSQEVNLDLSVSVGLKIELAFKSKELEKIYIPDILNILKIENNPKIENILNQFIVRRLNLSGLNSLELQSKKCNSCVFRFGTIQIYKS